MTNSLSSIRFTGSLRLRLCIAVLPIAFVLSFANAAHAQIFSDTLMCDSVITINIGDVLVGNTATDTLLLLNDFGGSNASWAAHNGTSSLYLSDTEASNIKKGSVWQTFIFCSPVSLGKLSSQINIIDDTDTTCKPTIVLSATGIGPTKDSTTFSLQDTSRNVIAFLTDSMPDAELFLFKNDSTSPIEIDDVYVTQTDTANAFSIISNLTFPFTLPSGSSFAVRLLYQRNSKGSDNGQLVITMPNKPILPAIALQGVRTANDAVQLQPAAPAYFLLYPNPSHGPVTIHTENIAQAHVTITDVLGRTLTEASFTGDYVWSGDGPANSSDQSGTYFVNISATTTGGLPVHEVRRIVVMR